MSSALDGPRPAPACHRQQHRQRQYPRITTPSASVRGRPGPVGARRGRPRHRDARQRSLEPTQLNGNNVNLDTETLSNIETVLRYQFAAQAVNGEFTAVRTAMRTN